MKSSSVINKVIKICSQCPRVTLRASEMFADEECDFNTGKFDLDVVDDYIENYNLIYYEELFFMEINYFSEIKFD